MTTTKKLEINRNLGMVRDPSMPEGRQWRAPSFDDFQRFASDHEYERWFIAEALRRFPDRAPAENISPETGLNEADYERFVELYGPDVVALMFEDGLVCWAPHVSPVDGTPYLELQLRAINRRDAA